MPGKSTVNAAGTTGRANCPNRGMACLSCPRSSQCAYSLAGKYKKYQQEAKEPAPASAKQSSLYDNMIPQDIVYLYDGSMPGFLCCVFESVYKKEIPAVIQPEEEAQPTLFIHKVIETDHCKAERVQKSIPVKVSERAAELIERAFLSCMPDKELAMLRFLLLGYKEGHKTPWMFGHPDVAPLLEAEKHMMGEQHLLRGFVRFSDYDGVLGATISPKNFVLPFLAEHFVARYPNEHFLIYDKTHKAALVYENRQPRIIPLDNIEFPQADEKEKQFRALWKRFYKTIAIEARTNYKCRRTNMPKRYWKNMVEMQEYL